MAQLLKPRQVTRIFSRNASQIVATVQQRTHATGPGSVKMWKNICLFVGFPCIMLSMLNSYLNHMEEAKHHDKRVEFIHYPYMRIMNKPFPWGDGKHSLFHNPKRNYIPGIGYEA